MIENLTDVLIVRDKKSSALETMEIMVLLGKMQVDYLFYTDNNWQVALA